MSLEAEFEALFGRSAEGAFAAPGRVNLIGEHTDYNEGFVLPLAIPHRVVAVAARSDQPRIRAASRQKHGVTEVELSALKPGVERGWAAYVLGVVWAVRDAGHEVGGLDILLDGGVPLGSGLSSSAALECATALALDGLYGLDIQRPVLARIAQKAENDFAGIPVGVLDQSASLLCIADHVLFMDTRTLDVEQVPLDLGGAGLSLLVIDTKAPHRHTDGEYAVRRRTCEAAAAILGVPALRDVDPAGLTEALARLEDPVMQRRVRHVVTEDERVLETVRRLRTGSPRDIGDLLTESHVSLRDDYEVTVPELDTAVEAALDAGALGARMTGGGFGGCVIALADFERVDDIDRKVAESFAAKGFRAPESFVVQASAGAGRLDR